MSAFNFGVMNKLKKLVKKYLKHFSYFYTHLRHRVFFALALSLAVGALDGFGLAMFLPLLQMVDGQQSADPEAMGNLSFLLDGMEAVGLNFTLTTVLGVMLFFFVLKGIAKFCETYYKTIVQRYFIRNLRFENIDGLSNYSYKKFVMADVGRIQNTLSGEVIKVLSAYRGYFMSIQAGVMVLVYIVLAFLANPEFALLVVIGGGLSNLVYQKVYKNTKDASKKLTREAHQFQALLIQKVAFFKYLKATGLIRGYAEKLKKIIVETEVVTLKMGWYNSILAATKEPLIVLVVVAVILVQVNYFSQSLGLIILSLLFFYRSLTFLMNLQTQWNSFLSSSGSLNNMTEFMDELRADQDRNGTVNIKAFNDRLVLNNVSFNYGNTAVLQNINLTIRKNETVAFVGESGSGKTTLVNVMTGLVPVEHGEFHIDGIDSKALNITSYQQRIGYITQEPVIFSDSIFNNVTFWAPNTAENQARFWAALQKAAIDTFVKSLPDQERSLLGNNGILVSGGQKQRLSIARELYKNVDILIMDEATSALDSETEQSIQANIDLLKGQYTILIVAHRLATVKSADKVVLLTKGKIENMGSFDQLKTSSKIFERMVMLQEI